MDTDKIVRVGELSTLITNNLGNIELIKTSDCLTFAAENRSDNDNVTLMPGDDTTAIIEQAKQAAIEYIEGKIKEWEQELENIFKKED